MLYHPYAALTLSTVPPYLSPVSPHQTSAFTRTPTASSPICSLAMSTNRLNRCVQHATTSFISCSKGTAINGNIFLINYGCLEHYYTLRKQLGQSPSMHVNQIGYLGGDFMKQCTSIANRCFSFATRCQIAFLSVAISCAFPRFNIGAGTLLKRCLDALQQDAIQICCCYCLY